MVPKLLLNIAKCNRFCNLTQTSNPLHSCNDIVDFQKVNGGAKNINEFQVPEPWSGDIVNAPILVISSNPAYSKDELYPTLDWPDKFIADFFINRFKDRGKYSWVLDNKVLNKDESRIRKSSYWSHIKNRVEEILGRTAVPGVDYCITELVHCKSSREIGVNKALPVCAGAFCKNILKISGAKLMIVIGSIARNYIENYCLSPNGIPTIYLPHPNSWGKKKVSDFYSEAEIERLRKILEKNDNKNRKIEYLDIQLPTDEEVRDFIEKKKREYKK